MNELSKVIPSDKYRGRGRHDAYNLEGGRSQPPRVKNGGGDVLANITSGVRGERITNNKYRSGDSEGNRSVEYSSVLKNSRLNNGGNIFFLFRFSRFIFFERKDSNSDFTTIIFYDLISCIIKD